MEKKITQNKMLDLILTELKTAHETPRFTRSKEGDLHVSTYIPPPTPNNLLQSMHIYGLIALTGFYKLEHSDVEIALKYLKSNNFVEEETVKEYTGYKITYEGKLLLENGGFTRKNFKSIISMVYQSSTTLLVAFGTIGLLIFQMCSDESQSENLKLEAKFLKLEKQQLEDLYTQEIYKRASTYQYEKELVRLRDSLGKRK